MSMQSAQDVSFGGNRSYFATNLSTDAVSAMTERIWEDKETEQRLTAKHPFRGIGRPQDIANAALFLASDDNTWMTGACVSVDGGYTAI